MTKNNTPTKPEDKKSEAASEGKKPFGGLRKVKIQDIGIYASSSR